MPITRTTWQKFSFNLLGGRLCSDNLGMAVIKLSNGTKVQVTEAGREVQGETAQAMIK